jgi:Phage integrase family
MEAKGNYHFVPRPLSTSHQHPYLVFDHQNRLHFHLTVFGKEAVVQQSNGTARVYLYAVLPFFTFLETDSWQQRAGRHWDGAPETVRQAVDDYLVQYLRCKVREHHFGFQLVSITQGTKSTIRVFLSGLKLFYRVMKQRGYYPFANPLIDPVSTLYSVVEEHLSETTEYPRLPDISGVEKPRQKPRLSDSYFKLEGETWIPQVIDDPTLPGKLLAGGRMIGWNLREECVFRILFEAGCRVSEAVGLTLGDWMARGMLQEANAFNKGSHSTRTKFLRFSSDTSKLLRRYFDEERRRYDLDGRTLSDYVQYAKSQQVDTNTVPLFLSTRGTPLSAKTFRENFWNPACMAAGIDVDIHQSRHWYVTQAVRQIYETAQTEAEVKRRLRELIEYIKWKQGWQTMEAYEHYFDAARHADVQDVIHQKMDETLRQNLEKTMQGKPQTLEKKTVTETSPMPLSHQIPDDPDFEFLCSMGGGSSGY